MYSYKINNDPEPIRLFKSDFMEFFTHIHPAVVVAIWAPVAIFFLVRGIVTRPAGISLWIIPLGYVIGLFLWTLAEYLLHRFLFHHHPRNAREERIFFLFHGIHHAQPQSKTRLVMPPIVSIPLALLFYGLFVLVMGVIFKEGYWIAPLFSGFISGYLAYDLTHYATHHFSMRRGMWKWLKRHHMRHHYKVPYMRFGVSSPLWDYVFNTMGENTD